MSVSLHICANRYVDRTEDVTEVKVYSSLHKVSLQRKRRDLRSAKTA